MARVPGPHVLPASVLVLVLLEAPLWSRPSHG